MTERIAIPIELCEQLERRNVLLFVGEGINSGILPSSAELASELAERCDYPSEEPKTLARVAGYYVLTTDDRHGLIDFLRGRLDKPGLVPSPSHRLIVQLRPRVIVTTTYDHLLEHTAREATIEYTPVVGNAEVAYGDEQKVLMVWLWGVLDRPDSVVITEDDRRQFLAGRENLSDVLRGELAQRTWLFLGFDAEDEWFRNFYDSVTSGLDRHRRRAYIVGATPSAYTRAWWAKRAQILDFDIELFLTELSSRLRDRKRPALVTSEQDEQVAVSLPERPYKLLDHYDTQDTAIFFGRAWETQQLTSLIHAHRLVLLYGASGVGKAALLLAGVVPRLERADHPYETVSVRVLQEPTRAVRRAVQRRLPEADLPEDGSLVDFVNAATKALDSTLVIVFDQFEDFFIRFSPRSRASFNAQFGELYDAHDVPVKLVFNLREDWLASISEIEDCCIPEVYRTKMRLLPLSRDQARQAITAPVERLGMRYESTLVDRLMNDLVVDEAMGSEGVAVMPPQLQLVCDAVYEHARAEGRHSIAMTDYEAVGGAQGILARYIETALREYPGGERVMAKGILMALVTSRTTKAATDLKSIGAEVGAEETVVERVLSRLIRQRLVRRLDEGLIYELAHDVLAETVSAWISEEDRRLKQAREMLRRELADWQQDPAILLSQSKFQRINALRDSLGLTDEETAFLLRAAILYGEDVPYWLEQVGEPDTRADILIEMVENQAQQARLTAAQYLAEFSQDEVATTLARASLQDRDPSVRDTAAVSLGRMGGQTGIMRLVETARTTEKLQQTQAVRALALVQDTAPDRLTEVTGRIRRFIYYELAKIRFGRNGPRIRMVTATGAVGGGIGFGLGLSPPTALHWAALWGSGSIMDMVFVAPFLALFGLLAGAVMAFGISAGESLLSRKPRLGRTLGGALLGGLGSAVGWSPLAAVDTMELPAALAILGGGLFGTMIGLGITAPAAITLKRAAALGGGAVGGILGIVVWRTLGFAPFQVGSVPTPVLLISGGLVGLILAFCITWAEARWPGSGREEK
jgi:hypothetical protein